MNKTQLLRLEKLIIEQTIQIFHQLADDCNKYIDQISSNEKSVCINNHSFINRVWFHSLSIITVVYLIVDERNSVETIGSSIGHYLLRIASIPITIGNLFTDMFSIVFRISIVDLLDCAIIDIGNYKERQEYCM